MNTVIANRFKGEIQRYIEKSKGPFESKIREAFGTLNIKTILCRSNIVKKDGYHAAHLLFILLLMPFTSADSVHSFCGKFWKNWTQSHKDSFYRFKKNEKFRWRRFFMLLNRQIFKATELDKTPVSQQCLILDDTVISKRGKKIENLTFVRDTTNDKTVLGFNIVTLALFNGKTTYPVDFSYSFSKTQHPKSPQKKIGDSRSDAGGRSFEAHYQTKLELGLSMIQNAVSNGITPRYVLFDSWYSWPGFISDIRNIDPQIHVVCRLKNSNVQYEYKGEKLRLGALYKRHKGNFKRDRKTGMLTKKVSVKICGKEKVTIVFTKGYNEPDVDTVKGKKEKSKDKWAAFLSTDIQQSASEVIFTYVKRWAIEVCFKECKQMLLLGKDQSNSFQSQVTATTLSFIRHNLLNYFNEIENHTKTVGGFFNHLVDETAVITYSHRIYQFFAELFNVALNKIFDLLGITEEFHGFNSLLIQELSVIEAFKGCET